MKKIKKVSPTPVEPEVKETVISSKSDGPIKVRVTQEELMRLQSEKRLIGYDPLTQEAIIKGEGK